LTESLLEFYQRHRISPVRQDIRDLQAHFARRAGLYRQLGILPGFLRGRTVLEIGPGSGFNSLYTASLEPSRYVMVEANPSGVDDIRRLFSSYPALAERIEVVSGRADDYESPMPFDFVFCEGMLALAGVPDPAQLLKAVARHTAPGGLLVITCIDALSDLSETLRRFVAQLLIDPDADLADQASHLLPVFSPHLSTLTGMSRRHDDWIIDNLLNPASIGPLLTLPGAVSALESGFDTFGTSPMFVTDWRWYKDIGRDGRFNELAIDAYWANVHNLLDYRHLSAPRDPRENHRLYDACVTVRAAVQEYERERDRRVLNLLLPGLDATVSMVRDFSPATSDAIAELRDALARPSLDPAGVAASRRFGPWFGRGQQYLSVSRHSDGKGAAPHERHTN
jgi:SAM-dependent methyltransferase